MIVSVIIAGVVAVFLAMSVAEPEAYLPEEGGTCAYAQKIIFACRVHCQLALGFLHHLCQGGSLAGLCPSFCHPLPAHAGKNYRHRLIGLKKTHPTQSRAARFRACCSLPAPPTNPVHRGFCFQTPFHYCRNLSHGKNMCVFFGREITLRSANLFFPQY